MNEADRHGDSPRDRLAELLRTCVECGLCLPHCATYLATGNEVQSPRGRLLLLSEALSDADAARDRDVLGAFDLCLGCRACETVCPSGVPFELLEHGLALAAADGALAAPPLAGFLDRISVLRWVRRAAGIAATSLRCVCGRNWRRRLDGAPLGLGRLARLLGSLPRSPDGDRALVELLEARTARCGGAAPSAREPAGVATPDTRTAAVEPRSGPRIVFFAGCANAALLPGSARRLRALLEACGCRVTVPGDQECCGALAAHAGRPERARRLQQRNHAAFAAALTGDAVLAVEAAGCGLTLRGYPEPVGDRVRDAVALLAELELPPLAAVPLRVALHDPCHARHGQGIVAEPRTLLRRIPDLTLLEPEEIEVCCGSGGAYSLRHAELSQIMGRRKATCLAATGADLVVTANPGCLGQIADGLALIGADLPVIPLTDLVWYAWQNALRARNEDAGARLAPRGGPSD